MTLPDINALEKVVGRSGLIRAEIERCASYSGCRSPVLIYGETGTGKEVFAKAVHCGTFKDEAPFVAVNCGGMPDGLIESLLFGHETGAFTGATRRQRGLIEQAEGGTLFLDEINSLPLLAQSKLLRFLQEREYRPLGAAAARQAHVRIISGTNEDLVKAIEGHAFRQDLYFRLNVLTLALPPLRDRPEDIPVIAAHLIARHCSAPYSPPPKLTAAALDKLMSYSWPGNVRELENVIQRALALHSKQVIEASDLDLPAAKPMFVEATFEEEMNRFKLALVQKALARHRGNISHVAQALHMDRKTVRKLAHQPGPASRSSNGRPDI